MLDAALPGVIGGFTTRAGGESLPPWDRLNLARHVGDDLSAVAANRALLARRFGGASVAFPEQVHGAGVAVVRERRNRPDDLMDEGAPGADAVVTALPDVPIGVLVADCMPVLLSDPVARVAGAAHAGRRGLVSGILQATVEAMAGLGAQLSRVEAVIGPSICGRCYEVPAEMREEVDAVVPGTAATTSAGTAGLDLPAGGLAVLRSLGVRARSAGICTAEDPRFYSYRRDGVTGRFAGVVMVTGDPHA